jgi:hypothetical protein
MPLAGFEPAIPASERPPTHAWNRTATGIVTQYTWALQMICNVLGVSWTMLWHVTHDTFTSRDNVRSSFVWIHSKAFYTALTVTTLTMYTHFTANSAIKDRAPTAFLLYSCRAPIVLRSCSYRIPIVLLPCSYRAPTVLLPCSYRVPTVLLPCSCRAPTVILQYSCRAPTVLLPCSYRAPIVSSARKDVKRMW